MRAAHTHLFKAVMLLDELEALLDAEAAEVFEVVRPCQDEPLQPRSKAINGDQHVRQMVAVGPTPLSAPHLSTLYRPPWLLPSSRTASEDLGPAAPVAGGFRPSRGLPR